MEVKKFKMQTALVFLVLGKQNEKGWRRTEIEQSRDKDVSWKNKETIAKKYCKNGKETSFGIGVKTLLGMPTSHITRPEVQTQLHSQFQVYARIHPGKQLVMARTLRSLSLALETQNGFLASGFSLCYTHSPSCHF